MKDTRRAAAAAGRPSRPKSSPGWLADLAGERLAIEGVSIEIDGGRFPAKAVAGRPFAIEADIFSDGHDSIDAAVIWRREGTEPFHEAPMTFLVNDRWRAVVDPAGERLLRGQLPRLARPLRHLAQRHREEARGRGRHRARARGGPAADRDGAAPGGGTRAEKASLRDALKRDKALKRDGDRFALMGDAEVVATMVSAGPRTNLTRYKPLRVFADREAAAFSAWYELMPRSQSGDPGRHGTFDDVIARLPYVQDLGFDVLYFPPIHPIGRDQPQGPQQLA